MGALRDVDPLVAAILDGDHDQILRPIIQAAEWRYKYTVTSAFKPGQDVVVVNPGHRTDGVVGRVIRVNKKSITVDLADGTSWRFGPTFLKTTVTGAYDTEVQKHIVENGLPIEDYALYFRDE